MAGFKTHITTSTVVGIGYGFAGMGMLHAPMSSALVAAGLCGVAGMLPDLDSTSGVPVRETMSFSSAVVPLLMMHRFEQLGMSREAMVFAGGLVYIVIRFGVFEIFKRYTVHRGMWHSIPAAVTAGLLAYLLCTSEDETIRIYKSGAVFLGFMTHLILDEIWSVEFKRGRIRFKKSFGTAMKFWSKNWWANFSVYAKLIVVAGLTFGDPMLMDSLEDPRPRPRLARPDQPEADTPSPAPTNRIEFVADDPPRFERPAPTLQPEAESPSSSGPQLVAPPVPVRFTPLRLRSEGRR